MTYKDLMDMLERLCELSGFERQYYTTHALRIGEATDRSMRGEPIESIMKFVGWRSRKSAMIYIRPDNPDLVIFMSDPTWKRD